MKRIETDEIHNYRIFAEGTQPLEIKEPYGQAFQKLDEVVVRLWSDDNKQAVGIVADVMTVLRENVSNPALRLLTIQIK